MRIATGGILHETNTFATGTTPLEAFIGPTSRDGAIDREWLQDSRGVGTPTGGFITASDEEGFELVPLLRRYPQPSAMVEQEAYDVLSEMLLERLEKALPVDGVLMDLHGAMVCEQMEDPAGDQLARVRRMVGPTVPIMAVLDLHANITPLMVENADALVGYDTYPHVDTYERGLEAGRLIVAAIEGKIRPVSALEQLPMLIPPPRQCTLRPPMSEIFDYVHEVEERPGIVCVTLSGGFPFADIHDAGASVVVTADADADLAASTAREIATLLWERRDEFALHLSDVDEAITEVIASGEGPVVLADGSDNPGGGAPCDGTVMLEALIRHDAPRSTVAIIVDPEAVDRAIAAGVGAQVTLDVGAKTDDLHGKTLKLTGHVRLISDGRYTNEGPMSTGARGNMGRTVVFVVGDVEIVLTERRIQPFDTAVLRSVGIEPTGRLLIGLKSAVHFRSCYQDLAVKIHEIDTPGVHHPDVTRYEYKKVRRPMWPLDEAASYPAGS